MIEILFKGKHFDTGEWIEGLPSRQSDGIIREIERLNSDKLTNGVATIEYIEVKEETVCQYTGLTDKNGRKIFEGDCLGHKENIVEYMSGGFVVSGDRPLSLMAKYNEVVGNIFDKE